MKHKSATPLKLNKGIGLAQKRVGYLNPILSGVEGLNPKLLNQFYFFKYITSFTNFTVLGTSGK